MSRFIGNTTAAGTNAVTNRNHNISDEDKYALYGIRFDWNYTCRNVEVTRKYQSGGWGSVWPSSNFAAGDPSTVMWLGQDMSCQGDNYGYEPWMWGESGSLRPYYLKGVVYDAAGATVSGATLYAFIQTTNILDGTGTSDSAGNYSIAVTNNPSSTYYVVGFYSSPVEAGSTYNNLTPAP